ncbi:MAG TPA: hypothetical protein GX505_05490 [Clostridiales bacterium]|nr:hypothetical protein [Clostridiales bacterium]
MEFDKQEAIKFISSGLAQYHSGMSDKERLAFTQAAYSFDKKYMKEMGFFDGDGNEDNLIYDEEDAFNYILGEFYKTAEYRKWKDALLEDMVDDYLELKYDYLVSKGLVEE